MEINGVCIDETYAEAFGMYASRVLITACSKAWALEAARSMAGYGTSVIGCGCEVAIEGTEPAETPDDRPGVSVMLFALSKKGVQEQLINRIGQCVMTSPTSACYNELEAEDRLSIGGKLKFFGDGFQISKRFDAQLTGNGGGPRRVWRIPVMDGEFIVEDRFGVQKGVGGGNFLLLGRELPATLQAAERAIEAMRKVPGASCPFRAALSDPAARSARATSSSTPPATRPSVPRCEGR